MLSLASPSWLLKYALYFLVTEVVDFTELSEKEFTKRFLQAKGNSFMTWEPVKSAFHCR